ncbi:MAG: hypothetical protein LBU61_00785 [Coriobacteriales bacterium]|jgi:hypothetical protein|nr:hypothetical protein [Coriobacteriales bacterium]
MSDSNREGYQQREKRFLDAIALKEPDRVPILEPGTNTFPYHYCGYSMAEILYDLEKAKSAIKKYHIDFDIDSGHTIGAAQEGQGPILEKSKSSVYYWAGMPEGYIDANSIHQFIEFPLLEDDEVGLLLTDRTGALLNKILPRHSRILAPFAQLNADSLMYPGPGINALAIACAQPEFKAMFAELAELGEMVMEYGRQAGMLAAEIEELGYPLMSAGMSLVSFDSYSDFIRGTMGAGYDLYDNPAAVKSYLDEHVRIARGAIRGGAVPNRLLFIPMHKAMDGFMSDEHYAEFYWPYLLSLVETALDVGMVPYVYTEGPYYSRLKFLRQLPPGCVVHFEGVDMATAKKELGDIACLSGNFPAHMLYYATKEQVAEEVKKLLDICMPGGGYIFDFDGGLYNYSPENVEACYETVKEYGKY